MAPGMGKGNPQLSDQLAGLEGGLVVAEQEVAKGEDASAGRAVEPDLRVEGNQHRREIEVDIGLGEVAADGRHGAHPHVADEPGGLGEHGKALLHQEGALQLAHSCGGTDREPAILLGNAGQALDTGDADEAIGGCEALTQQKGKHGAATQGHRVLPPGQERDRIFDGRRLKEIEGSHKVSGNALGYAPKKNLPSGHDRGQQAAGL